VLEPLVSNLKKSGGDIDAASIPGTEAEIKQFNQRGLFIGGCPKSGTTLLLSLLDGHPQLVVLPEETFYLENRQKFMALKSFDDKLNFLLEKTDLRFLAQGRFEPQRDVRSADARDYSRFDFQKFLALAENFIRQPEMNDSLFFSEIIRAYAIVLGLDWRRCARWVEKTTSNEVRFAAMHELFSDAKLIQLLRDPRAVFASRKKRLMSRYGKHAKAHRLVREWNRTTRETPRLRTHPEKNLVIRYEDLVRQPQSIIEKVCRFAGLEFFSAMLQPTRAGEKWQGNSAFQENFNDINAASVDQWKNYLSEHEIWWIELHCRQGMVIADYPLQTDARFSLARWLKRLPGESWSGYFRARRASVSQWRGWIPECNYAK
jgi:hypothetical protein